MCRTQTQFRWSFKRSMLMFGTDRTRARLRPPDTPRCAWSELSKDSPAAGHPRWSRSAQMRTGCGLAIHGAGTRTALSHRGSTPAAAPSGTPRTRPGDGPTPPELSQGTRAVPTRCTLLGGTTRGGEEEGGREGREGGAGVQTRSRAGWDGCSRGAAHRQNRHCDLCQIRNTSVLSPQPGMPPQTQQAPPPAQLQWAGPGAGSHVQVCMRHHHAVPCVLSSPPPRHFCQTRDKRA